MLRDDSLCMVIFFFLKCSRIHLKSSFNFMVSKTSILLQTAVYRIPSNCMDVFLCYGFLQDWVAS